MASRSKYILLPILLVGFIAVQNLGGAAPWFFGIAGFSPVIFIAIVFGCGLLAGMLLAWPRSRVQKNEEFQESEEDFQTPRDGLSDEDRDYIR